jgi:BlaI family penicillinase repressor
MDKRYAVTQSEWPIMELLWESPRTLMEMVNILMDQIGWSKSTIVTMVRRMDDKGLITFHTEGRTKIFRPVVTRDEVAAHETTSLLQRAYNGSVGMLISAMAHRNDLTKADIDELYTILKEAEETLK